MGNNFSISDDNKRDLYHAAVNGDYNLCKNLLEKGVNPNASFIQSFFPLIAATINNRYEICELLLDYGADVNIKGNFGESALHEAAYLENVDLCELLIRYGADENAKDGNNRTVVDYMFLRKPKLLIRKHLINLL